MVYKFGKKRTQLILDHNEIPIGVCWKSTSRYYIIRFFDMDKKGYIKTSKDDVNLFLQKLENY